jgi:hypothetical protein
LEASIGETLKRHFKKSAIMGVNDLPKLLRDGKKLQNSLSELNGTVCGVDLSVDLHKMFNKLEFA